MFKFDIGDIVKIVGYPPGTLNVDKTNGINIGDITIIKSRQLGVFYDETEPAYRVAIDDGLFYWCEDNFVYASEIETVTDEEFDRLLQE